LPFREMTKDSALFTNWANWILLKTMIIYTGLRFTKLHNHSFLLLVSLSLKNAWQRLRYYKEYLIHNTFLVSKNMSLFWVWWYQVFAPIFQFNRQFYAITGPHCLVNKIHELRKNPQIYTIFMYYKKSANFDNIDPWLVLGAKAWTPYILSKHSSSLSFEKSQNFWFLFIQT
jgi:hypothetical protein